MTHKLHGADFFFRSYLSLS